MQIKTKSTEIYKCVETDKIIARFSRVEKYCNPYSWVSVAGYLRMCSDVASH